MNAYRGVSSDELFQVSENVFRATLSRLDQRGLGHSSPPLKNEEKILSYLEQSSTISRAQAEKITGLSTASAARLLRLMVNDGKLSVLGTGRNTQYAPA